MLWDPGSVNKDEEEGQGSVPITPILVPLQNKPPSVEKGVPVLVPDVQDLKDQFQQQQNMLTQIKETLKQNESQLSSKGKQMEAYANKLSQIRARSKNTFGTKQNTAATAAAAASQSSPKMQKKASKENLSKSECPEGERSSGNSSKSRKGKVSELKKCLEENKIKFEQRTGKEQSESKKIETLVEQLKVQLEERDKTIHELQKTIEEPSPKVEPLSKQRSKLRESVASKTTQTPRLQPPEESNEVAALQTKILQLEANVLDLEENLREKESVIEARTQAVTLLSQDLSLKGKNTLESLEETRQEMRTMQSNFVAIEDQLRKDLAERNKRIATLEEKYKKLESTNFELSLKNGEQQEKLVNLQAKYLEIDAERKSLKESGVQGQTDDKLDELTKKINGLTKELDDRNKAMIKMKIEHKNKMKNLNKTLETLKGTSDEKAEIVRLNAEVEELETVKTGLENRVAELEDEKASEKKLKDQINELEIIIKKQNDDLSENLKRICNLEKENLHLVENNKAMKVENDNKLKELKELEDKMEELKGEHRREVEALESQVGARGEALDRKALEEFRISTEMSNIHVEEQIELLVREKQQLLEKLKSLSGVSSTDSLTFEKMEHSDLRDDRETGFPLGEEVDVRSEENRAFHLERIVSDQQQLINDLQKAIAEEKEKVQNHQQKVSELEGTIRGLEDANVSFKQQIEMSEAAESGKNTKTNTNTKNRIKKIEMELTQSKKAAEEQKEKLEELKAKLQEKEDLIRRYTEQMEVLEKDEWDRENHWKNSEEEMENMRELQKKCLSLENGLFELNEDCERLRKENVEVVHLLSEEKVKRRKLVEELEARRAAEEEVQRRAEALGLAVGALEERVERLERCGDGEREREGEGEGKGSWERRELEEKLEWTNVVLASKETEMFRLQNMLEDRDKVMEIVEAERNELKRRVEERESELRDIINELKSKDAQLRDISANFNRLQENVNAANEKTTTNEAQLKELLSAMKDMEGDVFRKESELQKIKGILEEKNLDIANLRNRLEEVNCDLTHSYQEHLENMGKCLRDKEVEFDALLAEKTFLEEVNQKLVLEKEDIYKQKLEIVKEKEVLQSEKEKLARELEEKTKAAEETKDKSQEKEDMKIKMKKLAANLKKKAQIEADLTKRVSEVEGALATALAEKKTSEERVKELEKQIRVVENAREKLKVVEREDKGKISQLEAKVQELTELREGTKKQTEEDVEKEKQSILQSLAEMSGKYENLKLKHEQLLLEQSGTEKRLEELQRTYEELLSEKSSLEAKAAEELAVIEALEGDLRRATDQMKAAEEKLFYSEDRRLSLESKNEEMCKKVMENSENLTTIDDLSVRIDELLQSEKDLQSSVKDLQCENSELKQVLDRMTTEKGSLEEELRASSEKLSEWGNELKELKNADDEKSATIRSLTEAVESLKAEKKQLSSEFEKLNRDYEQFEADFRENLENSQNVEKSLRHKIEELVSDNASLNEKCTLLSEGRQQEEAEEKKPKKRKSVTFRTDEVEYIKDLKGQLHEYDAKLKKAQAQVESLQAELLKERLRGEAVGVVAEAGVEERCERVLVGASAAGPGEVEERKFDGSMFFGGESKDPFVGVKAVEGAQGSEFDSLMWDDSWGAEGHLEAEYLSEKVIEKEKQEGNSEIRVQALEAELKALETENEKLKKELQEQTTKYAKALKKLKELKATNDKLQSETNKLKNSVSFGDLDATIVDELKAQIESMEAKEKELVKNLENSKLEKETLLKRIDVLNAGNEKFLEMKERQDNEVEIWQRKNDELLREIAALRQRPTEAQVLDDSALFTENQELRNKVEALEWKNCELIELLEEKQELLEGNAQTTENNIEKVMKEKSELQKQIEELNNVKERLEKKLFDEEEKSTMTIGELNEQLTALATENETLQDILGEMKKTAEAAKKEKLQEKQQEKPQEKPQDKPQDKPQEKAEESKIFDYFKSSVGADLFSAVSPNSNCNIPQQNVAQQRPEETEALRRRISDLEEMLRQKEGELQKLWEVSGEIERLQQRLSEAETAMRTKDEEFGRLQMEKEGDRQKFLEMEMDKDREISCLRQSVTELENLIKVKSEESQAIKICSEREVEALMCRVQELEGAATLKNELETVDLNRRENEAEELRQRLVHLEGVLGQREEELRMLSEGRAADVDDLQQRLFQLEEELRRAEANRSGEVEALSRKTAELEELARLRENEFCQLQSAKAAEAQSLSQRVAELENALRGSVGQQQAFELENLLRVREEECERKGAEVEGLRVRVVDLERAVQAKDEEIVQLTVRLNELEKNYNDSKIEIERLLNEEKLNVEEKFVEPFQENMKIPVAFEVEAMSRTLDEERQKSENLLYELSEKQNLLTAAEAQVQNLTSRLQKAEMRLQELAQTETSHREAMEESTRGKVQLEKMVSELQVEVESANLQLSVARRELEELQSMKDEAMSGLKSHMFELESELEETKQRAQREAAELQEKTKYYEAVMQGGRAEEEERIRELESTVEELEGRLEKETRRAEELRAAVAEREADVADLKETLTHLQEEIGHFRNFEKQVKDLRVAQIKEAGSDVSVTSEGHPDLSDWTEHELAELSTRLQSDLDTALYMLHQRDVRCDELTFELMQLLEERDTLQLRLSTALRINEELRAAKSESTSAGRSLQESKDLVDQSNDRQQEKMRVPGEDLQKLAHKISELHSVSYLRDKTVKDESVQRHKDQMNLLSRVSDSDITLSRDFQSSPTVLLNWMRGKTTPKVMHI